MKFYKLIALFFLVIAAPLVANTESPSEKDTLTEKDQETIAAPLAADSECLSGNDTLTEKDQDPNALFKYLTGTWNIKGTWQVLEGEGKVKYSSRATLSGKETYKPILNGHFLEKNLQAKVSYYSRDFGKKLTSNFSTLTMYTYNDSLGNFLFWYYDSTGAFSKATGSYTKCDNEYAFSTESLNDQGEMVQTRHVIQVVSDQEYKWEVRQKSNQDYEWVVSASGSSQRAS